MKNYKSLQNGSDIRGIAMDIVPGEAVNLTEEAAFDLGQGFAEYLRDTLGKNAEELTVAVGRDSRLSGPALMKSFSEGLTDSGVCVIDCGMASTPAMFMATVFPGIGADGAVMVTASHLPVNRNGFKFFTAAGGLEKKDISRLIGFAEADGDRVCTKKGTEKKADLMELYCSHLRKVICSGLGAEEAEKPLSGLHAAVDAGNGAGGFYVSRVLEPLGADCTGSRYLEPDGNFPNHQPNPENKAAMQAVSEAVRESGADLGIIFDTDVDRAAAVDSTGKAIDRNAIVALAAVLASEGESEPVIVTDSITSTQLNSFLTGRGMKHLRYMRGYKNVINKGLELNAAGENCVLAIETSGHAAMRENYFLDDGAYLATRIVVKAALLKKEGKGIENCIEELKEPAFAKEFRLPVMAEDFAKYADQTLEKVKTVVSSGIAAGMTLELPNYEGVRVNADPENGDGWFLIRKSLHEPLMPVNIESNSAEGLEKIKKALLAMLSEFDGLDLSLLK